MANATADADTKLNHVLIDFENVQPRNLSLLVGKGYQVHVFVGENQTKLPFELVEAMQQLGDAARYVKISGNGRNALDFHIAFTLGELVHLDPKGYFHVISRDTGFDPLIKHLRRLGVEAHREQDLAEIPPLRTPATVAEGDKVGVIVRNLAGRGPSRPRKVKTLTNTIISLFKPKLEDAEAAQLIRDLKEQGYISLDGDKVAYKLPRS
ncbi:PIN domain-containing protein [uncultured Thiohalocapsa sp.]|uniref:PIN domain-containing protein n=1 Tax=uncultured Thiohalocapsa sp. TaxID=768990 RepID=UPI0025E50171|nr:PIN domain-containing protein [uncultured Thiohalocapsa sp.]